MCAAPSPGQRSFLLPWVVVNAEIHNCSKLRIRDYECSVISGISRPTLGPQSLGKIMEDESERW